MTQTQMVCHALFHYICLVSIENPWFMKWIIGWYIKIYMDEIRVYDIQN